MGTTQLHTSQQYTTTDSKIEVTSLLGEPEQAQGKVVFDASDHTQKFMVRMWKPPHC